MERHETLREAQLRFMTEKLLAKINEEKKNTSSPPPIEKTIGVAGGLLTFLAGWWWLKKHDLEQKIQEQHKELDTQYDGLPTPEPHKPLPPSLIQGPPVKSTLLANLLNDRLRQNMYQPKDFQSLEQYDQAIAISTYKQLKKEFINESLEDFLKKEKESRDNLFLLVKHVGLHILGKLFYDFQTSEASPDFHAAYRTPKALVTDIFNDPKKTRLVGQNTCQELQKDFDTFLDDKNRERSDDFQNAYRITKSDIIEILNDPESCKTLGPDICAGLETGLAEFAASEDLANAPFAFNLRFGSEEPLKIVLFSDGTFHIEINIRSIGWNFSKKLFDW